MLLGLVLSLVDSLGSPPRRCSASSSMLLGCNARARQNLGFRPVELIDLILIPIRSDCILFYSYDFHCCCISFQGQCLVVSVLGLANTYIKQNVPVAMRGWELERCDIYILHTHNMMR